MSDPFAGLLTLPPPGDTFVPLDVEPPLDPEPPDMDDATPPPPVNDGVPRCEICQTELEYSGKGRKPKRCELHRRTRTSETAQRVDPGRGRSTVDKRRLDRVQGDLELGLGKLTGTIIPIAPVTGVTIAFQGPPAIAATVRIAADYPRFLEGLELAAKTVPFIEIGTFLCALILAIGVDMGRANPYGLAGEYLGVAKAAHEVGWEPPPPPDQAPPGTTSEGFTIPTPGRFKL